MKLIHVKTTRFSEVVAQCGQPVSYTLWQKLKKDPALAKLIAKNQIMTIRRGLGADFGEVGFYTAKSTIYLHFPKSLKAFAGQRIIGIKWELLKT